MSIGYLNSNYGWIQTWNSTPVVINSLGNQILLGTTTSTTSGGFSSTTVGIKQLSDGGSGGGLHIESYTDTNVAFFGFTGSTFRIGTSYRSAGSYMPIEFTTSASTRLYIGTNGYIGVGTTSPNSKLDLGGGYGASGEKFLIYNDNTSSALAGTKAGFYLDRFSLSNNTTFVFATYPGYDGSYIIASKNTSDTTLVARMTVRGESGNVGIGTTSPSDKLHISSTFDANIRLTDSGVSNADWSLLPSSGNSVPIFRLYNRGTATVCTTWTTDGKVGIGTTSPSTKLEVNGTITETSSIRYKENIESIKYALDKVLQMRGVTYTRKDSGLKEVGFIAEEIHDIYSDLVVKNEEGLVESVSYGRFTALLIEAIKELKIEIEELKANR
jgi:hypothetical protein